MAIEKFNVRSGESMYGITFDLDTKILKEDFGVSRSIAYRAIESKLVNLGYTHVEYSVYFCEHSKGAMSFAYEVEDIFSTFMYASAITRLHGFEVKEWSDMRDRVVGQHKRVVKSSESLWPEQQ